MKYEIIFFVLFILLLLFIILFFYDKYKKKYVVIFGSVSKDISDDINLQKDLKYLASNLNTTKYNYILPNTKKGPIGYLLNNIKEDDKSSILTTYSTTFGDDNINKNFQIKLFNDPIDFEEYMIRNSNIFVILPGGIGTLYEIAFLLFLIDVSDVNYKIIFYNKNNYYDFINDLIKRYYETGYLRPNIYDKFKAKTYFVNNIEDINKIID